MTSDNHFAFVLQPHHISVTDLSVWEGSHS